MAQAPFSTPHFDIMLMVEGVPTPQPSVVRPRRNPPMKIAMLLHFYSIVGPFAPEEQRTSPKYSQFVRELLKDGLIERPTKRERAEHPGWAYAATAKGDALVNAICTVPNPVERTRWVMPA